MSRPRVDVIVPFRGGLQQLEALLAVLGQLALRPGDTLVVVDNTPGAGRTAQPGHDRVGAAVVVQDATRATPGFARNRGAILGTAEWLVFLDADVEPYSDLIDRYFDEPVADSVGLLAGAVLDETVQPGGPAAARYAYLGEKMSQSQTFRLGRWGFAQTANVAVRREAFDAVGGFRDDIRAGEDADFCYRLREAGWEIERREAAQVTHRARRTVREFAVQQAVHGAAAAWLEREYPGSFPARRRPGLVWWGTRRLLGGVLRGVRRRDRDELVSAVLDPLEQLSYEFGRSLSNDRRRRG
jgi:GT2 family glycosyltransferase